MKHITEMSDQEIAQFCVQLCLVFGSEVDTAYQVAADFVRGVQYIRSNKNG